MFVTGSLLVTTEQVCITRLGADLGEGETVPEGGLLEARGTLTEKE